MTKRKMVVAALLTALALVMAPIGTAQAGSVATAVFVGKAIVGTPLCFPALCPKPAGPVTWSFSAGPNFPSGNAAPSLCVGASASLPTKAGKSLAVGTCDIVASGTLTGIVPGVVGPWCGHSVGSGTGTITYTKTKTYSTSISWISAGSFILLTGTASKGGQSGPLAVVVDATGDRVNKGADGSCLAPGATAFIVVGIAAGAGIGTK